MTGKNMIYLARHGETFLNSQQRLNGQIDMDTLTDLGTEQAHELGEKCTDLNIKKIYCSPLHRARATAIIAGTIIGIQLKNIQIIDGLKERDFGKMTGKLISEIPFYADETLQPNENSLYILSGMGVETFPNLQERVRLIYKWLLEKHPHENILVVSHGDVMKMFESIHRNIPWREVLMQGHYTNGELVCLD